MTAAQLCPMTMGPSPANPERCIGADCMAWRGVHPGPGRVLVKGRAGEAPRIVSEGAAKQFRWTIVPVTEGYCGLAGRPA